MLEGLTTLAAKTSTAATLEGRAEPEPEADKPEGPSAEPEEDLAAQVRAAEEVGRAEIGRGIKAAAASIHRQPRKVASKLAAGLRVGT